MKGVFSLSVSPVTIQIPILKWLTILSLIKSFPQISTLVLSLACSAFEVSAEFLNTKVANSSISTELYH